MKEGTYYVVDSLGVSHPMAVETAGGSVSQFFVEGGVPGMIVLTLFLIALLLAAWKAPGWVREIGLGALVTSVFWTLLGLYQMFGAIQMMGDVRFPVICGGLRIAMISTFYGLIIYFISLLIRIIQKPRI